MAQVKAKSSQEMAEPIWLSKPLAASKYRETRSRLWQRRGKSFLSCTKLHPSITGVLWSCHNCTSTEAFCAVYLFRPHGYIFMCVVGSVTKTPQQLLGTNSECHTLIYKNIRWIKLSSTQKQPESPGWGQAHTGFAGTYKSWENLRDPWGEIPRTSGTALLGDRLHLPGISANLPCIHSYNKYVWSYQVHRHFQMLFIFSSTPWSLLETRHISCCTAAPLCCAVVT